MKQVIHWLKKYRWWLIGLVALIVFVVLGPWLSTIVSGASATYDSAHISAKDVPKRDVAIVFGAKENNGSPSPYLQFRIDAAVALYKAGTVKKLLMTGDNSTPGYNEPTVMADTAVKMGVKREDVVLDYAGFSTFDSCYRAKYIFGVTSAILVTQNYHLPRAIFTCRGVGVESIGYGAYATQPLLQLQYTIREWFSTDKTVIQILTHAKSKYLGPQELIKI
jgi:vancomycin permeability regulator SanA